MKVTTGEIIITLTETEAEALTIVYDILDEFYTDNQNYHSIIQSVGNVLDSLCEMAEDIHFQVQNDD